MMLRIGTGHSNKDKKSQSEFNGIRGLKRKQVGLFADWYSQEEW